MRPVTIQIEQTFPHCERCGRMLHWRMPRFAAVTAAGAAVALCSERCRDEYERLDGTLRSSDWVEGANAPQSGRRHGVAV